MWYEYEEHLSKVESNLDYDEIREDLVNLQGKVDDVLGQGTVFIYLNIISPTDYEVYFESPEIGDRIFEDNAEDLFSSIKVAFPNDGWLNV